VTERLPFIDISWPVNVFIHRGSSGKLKIILGVLPRKKGWETLGHKPSAWFALGTILASPAEA
jgi:hypothetical protein